MPPARARELSAATLWRRRLRWRLRGASQWPAFAVLTVLDAVLLWRLPFAGGGTGPVAAVLLAGFLNLTVVAALAPVVGRLLRRWRAGLPDAVARDIAGTACLMALAVALVIGGLLHRPSVVRAGGDREAAVAAAQAWMAHNAPAEYRGAGHGDTWSPGPGLYRACYPGPDPRRALCLLVSTGSDPPVVRRDPDQRPNATVAGPDNPGRR